MKLVVKRTKSTVDKSVWLDPRDNNMSTPLMVACVKERYDIIEFLVKEGADVEATDKDGDTAIHLIAMLLRKKIFTSNKTPKDIEDIATRLTNINIGGSDLKKKLSKTKIPKVPTNETAPEIYAVRSMNYSQWNRR